MLFIFKHFIKKSRIHVSGLLFQKLFMIMFNLGHLVLSNMYSYVFRNKITKFHSVKIVLIFMTVIMLTDFEVKKTVCYSYEFIRSISFP